MQSTTTEANALWHLLATCPHPTLASDVAIVEWLASQGQLLWERAEALELVGQLRASGELTARLWGVL